MAVKGVKDAWNGCKGEKGGDRRKCGRPLFPSV